MCLTERVGRGIALTPAAEILVAHTDALLGQLDALKPRWLRCVIKSRGT
jgi:DNA-binding transcriptional LysR family regulator